MGETTNQSCANCGGLLAPMRDGDTAKHFDGSYYCIANRTHAELTKPNEPTDDPAIVYSAKPGCPTCLSPQPHLHPAVQHEGEVSICKDPFHSKVTSQNPKVGVPIRLIGGQHQRNGGTHTEWHSLCGCAFHPNPFPHVHPCSDGHKRPDLHATEEQAIVTAAREWAKAWGKVWEGDESATDEVNDKSKLLHDAVLDLEREIVLRRRRAVMPDYDKKLEDWLS